MRACYASDPAQSRGRRHPQIPAPTRTEFQRDRDRRYQSALDILTDLEMHLYRDGYGPTNEKLGIYIKDLFEVRDPIIPALPTRHPPVK
jgi:serine/threonine-protein kinase